MPVAPLANFRGKAVMNRRFYGHAQRHPPLISRPPGRSQAELDVGLDQLSPSVPMFGERTDIAHTFHEGSGRGRASIAARGGRAEHLDAGGCLRRGVGPPPRAVADGLGSRGAPRQSAGFDRYLAGHLARAGDVAAVNTSHTSGRGCPRASSDELDPTLAWSAVRREVWSAIG